MYPGHWAKIQADKAAAINSETGEAVSYGELDQRSMRLAQLMYRQGLRRGDHIAIFMENNLRYFEVMWAALRSGLYVTPVNRFLTAEEAAYIINDCEAKVLVSSIFLKDTALQLRPLIADDLICLMTDGLAPGYVSYEAELENYEALELDEQPLGNYMLYSSGSTGRPKGIVHRLSKREVQDYPERGLAPFKPLWGWDESTCYLSTAPMYHSGPVAFTIGTQRMGGTVVMMPKYDSLLALAAIEKYRVTHSQCVPTMFSRLLKLPAEDKERFDLSSMKYAIHGAAPCPVAVKRKMIDWWGPIIYEYYSATEGMGQTHATTEEWLLKPGTVGKAFIGVIHVCDEQGKELPAGESGLIYFEAPKMPFRYHGDKEKTKSSQHPEHDNWSAPGDIGYVDEDGYLFLNDRASFMIISGGVNIYPREIEDAILLHPKVADVAVIGVPNEEMGEEVKAFVQLENPAEESDSLARELIAHSREHIAHYKSPKSIDFMAELPRLPTGKLYKNPLKEKYWKQHTTGII